jgi:hypothetical protein
MPNIPITTIEELHDHLRVAMQLEHSTIPPYLLALYSIRPDTNEAATRILRTIVVEEMLHLSLAANIMNAVVGGTVDFTVPDFVPTYPALLPDGEDDFTVSLRPFSCAALDTFLNIERPKKASADDKKLVDRGGRKMAFSAHPQHPKLSYYSIGEFYQAIADGLKTLDEAARSGGPALFRREKTKQVGPEYYNSGGGKLLEVTDLKSALTAISTIIEQGEGFDSGIFNQSGELAHDYRFEQLKVGRYYLAKNASGRPDSPGSPTGPELKVDWDAVFPSKVNAKLVDYLDFPWLHGPAVAFNQEYFEFLGLLTKAFNGEPDLLQIVARHKMHSLGNLIRQLVQVPLPGTSLHAAPTFEMPNAVAADTQEAAA